MGALAHDLKALHDARVASSDAHSIEGDDYEIPEGKIPSYHGEVWVFAEQEDGELHTASFELLGRASALAKSLHEKSARWCWAPTSSRWRRISSHGADKVYVSRRGARYLSPPFTAAMAGLIGTYQPQMLISRRHRCRELAPRLPKRFRSHCGPYCPRPDRLEAGRQGVHRGAAPDPALGGNIMASILTQNSKVQMSTTRPGVLKALEPDSSRIGEVIRHTPDLSHDRAGTSVVSYEPIQRTAELSEAGVIASGGIGCRTKENYDTYIRSLARALGEYLGEESMVGGQGCRRAGSHRPRTRSGKPRRP
jgi:electron transfer flavoprotein alpha subunit